MPAQPNLLWIDEKTFLLRRSLSDSDNEVHTPAFIGHAAAVVNVKSHDDEQFTDQRLNETIPDSTFTVPAAQ